MPGVVAARHDQDQGRIRCGVNSNSLLYTERWLPTEPLKNIPSPQISPHDSEVDRETIQLGVETIWGIGRMNEGT